MISLFLSSGVAILGTALTLTGTPERGSHRHVHWIILGVGADGRCVSIVFCLADGQVIVTAIDIGSVGCLSDQHELQYITVKQPITSQKSKHTCVCACKTNVASTSRSAIRISCSSLGCRSSLKLLVGSSPPFAPMPLLS